MQIGKRIRTIIVEPLESPVPVTTGAPEADDSEPTAPTHKTEPEPEHDPVTT
jgi:hypothetical protein